MKTLKMSLFFALLILVLVACGGGNDAANGNDAPSDEPLALEEGQFYVVRASGAVNDTIVGTNWGGEDRNRRLFDMEDWWTLRLGGSNTESIALIHLDILKGLEPGTYTLTPGSVVNTPDTEEPVKVMFVEVNSAILNDEEEFDGTLTIDAVSDENMSGSIDMTLFTESGEVAVEALFDVPVVEAIQPS